MPAFKPEVEEEIKLGVRGAWYVVAKSVQVRPGKTLPVKALGEKLVLWRGEDGKVRATADRCPHRGAPLSLGIVIGNDVSCHYHGLAVDGEGKIAKVPALPNCSLEGRKGTDSYAVEECADGVFVYFPSEANPEPIPFEPPAALTDPGFQKFLCTATWDCDWRFAVDNLVDPMHGTYLHTDTFTLGGGSSDDLLRIVPRDEGFTVERKGQQGKNFDYANANLNGPVPHIELSVPYPDAAGPGGPLELLPMATPIDEKTTQIFFWRMRAADGLAGEAWKFLWRAKFEELAWFIIEQDREMIEGIPLDAREREMLYQHDIGVGQLRKWMTEKAEEIMAARAAKQADVETQIAAE